MESIVYGCVCNTQSGRGGGEQMNQQNWNLQQTARVLGLAIFLVILKFRRTGIQGRPNSWKNKGTDWKKYSILHDYKDRALYKSTCPLTSRLSLWNSEKLKFSLPLLETGTTQTSNSQIISEGSSGETSLQQSSLQYGKIGRERAVASSAWNY